MENNTIKPIDLNFPGQVINVELGRRSYPIYVGADILSQFMLEAIVLSAMGGLMGVISGLGVAKLVDVLGLMRAVPSPLAVALALGAALAVGMTFGIYPANSAAALSPIEALRYE